MRTRDGISFFFPVVCQQSRHKIYTKFLALLILHSFSVIDFFMSSFKDIVPAKEFFWQLDYHPIRYGVQ